MGAKNNFYEQLLLKLSHLFDEIYTNGKNIISYKEDESPVTTLDHKFSETIEKYFHSFIDFKRFHFFSEEKHHELKFPAIIVDPIDGTRELAQGVPECAVSISVMLNSEIEDKQNHAWIYNPFTGESLELETLSRTSHAQEDVLIGFVSNTEWKAGLYQKFSNERDFVVSPLGSIAYKLLKLANDECDFVVTLKPKHIWDIAGGTVLLARKGVHLYGPMGRIFELDSKIIDAPLIWCREKNYDKLKKHFFN